MKNDSFTFMAKQYNKIRQAASNIFHSIMKGSVKQAPKKICLYCELPMELIEPPVEKGKVVVSKYECPNGHTVEVTERI